MIKNKLIDLTQNMFFSKRKFKEIKIKKKI